MAGGLLHARTMLGILRSAGLHPDSQVQASHLRQVCVSVAQSQRCEQSSELCRQGVWRAALPLSGSQLCTLVTAEVFVFLSAILDDTIPFARQL